ncbi:hypothetical protein nbrc107696_21660 [Gordonia spumicola]|uniref:DUF3068 domain-containing protein n=1 Tax=Gordonia spumicola TaxID=589161 RepID=A0A7I9V9H1_9ACTN|nr:DUF3068 domain-containing protein [Gordonia spumicola]GEE01720.1 hypothetical protein nbrc107696_21660 [Gordonia spumicola]
MKRVLLALLAFFGVAFIAAGVVIPTYLVPKLKVVPLDLDITSVATTVAPQGETGNRFPAVIFDRCSVTKKKAAVFDAHLTQQRRSVIVDPSDENQATLQSAQTVRIDRVRDAAGKERDLTMATEGDRPCDDALLTATVDRVSVDRKTSVPNGKVSSLQLEAVPEGGKVDDASVHIDDRKGFQYKFGFGVQKREYYYYDLLTRQDTAAKFVDEKVIDGVTTYHFQTEVPETDLSNLPDPAGEAPLGTILNMPASWWGITGKGVKAKDMVEMHRYGASVRNVYVEPTTGTIVYGYEEQHQYFKSPDDSTDNPRAIRDFRMDALKATFAWSDETASQQADRAKHYLNLLKWGGTYAPIVLIAVGAVLLLLWLFLVWRGRKRPTGGDVPDAPVDDPDQTSVLPAPAVGTDIAESPGRQAEEPYVHAQPYAPYGPADETPTTAYAAPGAYTFDPASYGDPDHQRPTFADPYAPPADTTVIPAQPQWQPGPDSEWAPQSHVAPSPLDDTTTGAFPLPEHDPTRPMPGPEQYPNS